MNVFVSFADKKKFLNKIKEHLWEVPTFNNKTELNSFLLVIHKTEQNQKEQ